MLLDALVGWLRGHVLSAVEAGDRRDRAFDADVVRAGGAAADPQALAAPHETSPAGAIEVALLERERFADP